MFVVLPLLACRHRIPTNPLESDLFYQQGLEAFRRATPDGYRDAINAFRRASSFVPSRCEYKLHLAESLLFLAQEQQMNWEEYVPTVSEVTAVIDPIQSAGECAGFNAFLSRVLALEFSFDSSKRQAAQGSPELFPPGTRPRCELPLRSASNTGKLTRRCGSSRIRQLYLGMLTADQPLSKSQNLVFISS